MLAGTEKIRIEGIKLSGELVAVIFRNLSNIKNHISRFCHILVENRVNLVFLTTTNIHNNVQVSFCVAVEDQALVKELVKTEAGVAPDVEFIAAVGALSIFHHQFDLKFLGLVLNIFGRARLPVYGLASSLSTLTCITDYANLNKAVKAIQEYIDVPSGQISLKPEFHVKQSQRVKD